MGSPSLVELDGLRRRGLVEVGLDEVELGRVGVAVEHPVERLGRFQGGRGRAHRHQGHRAQHLPQAGVVGAVVGGLGQQGLQHRRQGAGPLDGPGRLVGDGGQGGLGGVALERRLALDRGVEGDAEGPQVGGGAAGGHGPVLGGQVAGGVGHRPGGGDVGVADEGGDAEVGQADGAVVGEEDPRRADEPVRQPGRGAGGQGLDRGHAHHRHPLRREGAVGGDHVGQGRPLHQLGDDEGRVVGVEDVDDPHQARVIEGRQGAGLGQQLLGEGGAGRPAPGSRGSGSP